VTFGRPSQPHFLHGSQVIAEKVKGKDVVELTALYVPGLRFNKTWSALAMVGVRTEVGREAHAGEVLLVNTTLFVEPTHITTAGLEFNLSARRDSRPTFLIMPQVHQEIDSYWTIQAGLGVELREGHAHSTAAFRLIWAPPPRGASGPHAHSSRLEPRARQNAYANRHDLRWHHSMPSARDRLVRAARAKD
jgi:hypothetical protein